MLALIKIEWLKIKKYPAFWWMLGIVALTYPGINLMFYRVYQQVTTRKDMTGAIAKSLLGNPYAFPESWHSVGFFSSLFVMIPAILVIMIITNEYQYKTHRQNVIDGWSKNQFITSKILDVAIITTVASIMYLLTAAGYGFTVQGDTKAQWIDEIKYIPLFFLQTFAQLTIAFLLGFLIKKAFIALGAFIFYFLVIENIILGLFEFYQIKLGRFLPFEISDKLIPVPKFLGKMDEAKYATNLSQINEHIVYTILLTAGIWWLCYMVYRKRDL
ncbi:MAG: ABC transporter permease [Chitinophagaceae bacterium]|jgi:ABC-2 type transport system permease protein